MHAAVGLYAHLPSEMPFAKITGRGSCDGCCGVVGETVFQVAFWHHLTEVVPSTLDHLTRGHRRKSLNSIFWDGEF